jgi:hypothetical protein
MGGWVVPSVEVVMDLTIDDDDDDDDDDHHHHHHHHHHIIPISLPWVIVSNYFISHCQFSADDVFFFET